jgi:hypothetical protein
MFCPHASITKSQRTLSRARSPTTIRASSRALSSCGSPRPAARASRRTALRNKSSSARRRRCRIQTTPKATHGQPEGRRIPTESRGCNGALRPRPKEVGGRLGGPMPSREPPMALPGAWCSTGGQMRTSVSVESCFNAPNSFYCGPTSLGTVSFAATSSCGWARSRPTTAPPASAIGMSVRRSPKRSAVSMWTRR